MCVTVSSQYPLSNLLSDIVDQRISNTQCNFNSGTPCTSSKIEKFLGAALPPPSDSWEDDESHFLDSKNFFFSLWEDENLDVAQEETWMYCSADDCDR